MDVSVPAGMTWGWIVGSPKPPQLLGALIVKGAFELRHGEAAAMHAEPLVLTGDVFANDEEGGKRFVYPSDFVLHKPRADVVVVGETSMQQTDISTGLQVGAFKKTLHHRHDSHASAPHPYSPVPPDAPQRASLLGTYDEHYVAQRWPWMPRDFDFAYFNAAPKDQQIDGYLRGDEELALAHLHPEHSLLRTRLPGLRVRCLVGLEDGKGALRYRDLEMRLDTLWIDVAASKLVLVWRGATKVLTPKMRELQRVVIATEPLAQPPLPAEHHLQAAAPKGKPKLASAAPADEASQAKWVLFEQSMAAMDEQFAAAEREIEQVEQELLGQEKKALADMPANIASTVPAKTLAPKASIADELKAALASAREQVPSTASALANVDVQAFAEAERELLTMEQAANEPDAGAAWSRERLRQAAASREALTDLDLRGLDLSGLDFRGHDFSGSVLIGASFARSHLAGARFIGSDLTRANFEQADLTGAVLDRADLSAAKLDGARLTQLSLDRTRCSGLDLSGADLSGSIGQRTNFVGAKLVRACFAETRFPSSDFTRCDVSQANFSRAVLTNASFCGAVAKGIDMADAEATALRADEAADFEGARFVGLRADRAVFDTSNLDGCDFTLASLKRAQFEGASLRATRFDRADLSLAMFDDARLQRTRFTHSNLLRVSFEGADLTGAVGDGANCFEAGFWRATEAKAAFARANRCRTLIE